MPRGNSGWRAAAALSSAPLIGLALPACGSECEPESGELCTIAGTGVRGKGEDGQSPLATDLHTPVDMTESPEGELWVLDWNNYAARVIRDGAFETKIGVLGRLGEPADEGPATEQRLNHPTDVTFDGDQIILSAWHNSMVMRYDLETKELQRMCGTGARNFNGDGDHALETDLDLPAATVVLPDGTHAISDQANQRVRRVDQDGVVETIAGTGEQGYDGDGGPATEATLSQPTDQRAPPAAGMDGDDEGNLYLADTQNEVIRKIDADGVIDTIAGTGATGTGADSGDPLEIELNHPTDVSVGTDGSVYIADTLNSCVRRVSPEYDHLETVAGQCGENGDLGDQLPATEALLDRPYGVEVGADGTLYIADTFNHLIRAVYP